MARSDLVLALAEAGNAGDRKAARVVTEAIIAEERAKQHTVLADKLSKAMHKNGNGAHVLTTTSDLSNRGRDFIVEIVPKRRLDDVILQWSYGVRSTNWSRSSNEPTSYARMASSPQPHSFGRTTGNRENDACGSHRGSGVCLAVRRAV